MKNLIFVIILTFKLFKHEKTVFLSLKPDAKNILMVIHNINIRMIFRHVLCNSLSGYKVK